MKEPFQMQSSFLNIFHGVVKNKITGIRELQQSIQLISYHVVSGYHNTSTPMTPPRADDQYTTILTTTNKSTRAITQGVQRDITMNIVMTTPTRITLHVGPTICHIHPGTTMTVTLKSGTYQCDVLCIDTRLQIITLIVSIEYDSYNTT